MPEKSAPRPARGWLVLHRWLLRLGLRKRDEWVTVMLNGKGRIAPGRVWGWYLYDAWEIDPDHDLWLEAPGISFDTRIERPEQYALRGGEKFFDTPRIINAGARA